MNNVVDELVNFRGEVRKFALSVEDQAAHDGQSDSTTQNRRPQPDRVPLLKTCDVLRNNLAPLGVHIKVQYILFEQVDSAEMFNIN